MNVSRYFVYLILIVTDSFLISFCKSLHFTEQCTIYSTIHNHVESFFERSNNIDILEDKETTPTSLRTIQGKTIINYATNDNLNFNTSGSCIQVASKVALYDRDWSENCMKYALLVNECLDQRFVETFMRNLRTKARVVMMATCICETPHVVFYNALQDRFGAWEDVRRTVDFMGRTVRVEVLRSLSARITQPYEEWMRLSDVRIEGIDPMVARVLSDALNFTMELVGTVSLRYGYKTPEGNFTEAIGNLLSGQADVLISGLFLKDYGSEDLVFTTPVYTDKLCIVVQKAGQISGVFLPLLAFSVELWLCVLAFIAFMILARLALIRLLSKIERRQPEYSAWKVIGDIVKLCVSAQADLPTSGADRLLLTGCLLCSLTLVGTYQGSLPPIYTSPPYARNIDSLRELEQSGLPVFTSHKAIMVDLLDTDSVLYRRLRLYKGEGSARTIAADTGTVAGVIRFSSMEFDIKQAQGLHMISECPRSYNIAYIMLKDSTYNAPIERVLSRIVQAGLVVKWYRDLHTNVTLEYSARGDREPPKAFKVLGLYDLQLAFMIALMGYVFGACALLREIRDHRNKRANVSRADDGRVYME